MLVSLQRTPDWYSPTSTQRTVLVVLWTKEISVSFLFFGQIMCDVILCSCLLSRIRTTIPGFDTRHDDANSLRPFDSMRLKLL